MAWVPGTVVERAKDTEDRILGHRASRKERCEGTGPPMRKELWKPMGKDLKGTIPKQEA